MKLRDLLKGTPAHPKLVPAPDPQCTSLTSKGTRCRLPKGTGGDKCAIHQAKAA